MATLVPNPLLERESSVNKSNKTYRTHKTKQKASDYEANSHNTKPKSTSNGSKSRSRQKNMSKNLAKDGSDVNMKDIPNPAPNGNNHTVLAQPTTLTVPPSNFHTGILPVVPSATLATSPTPGFSPLPPLASFATTATTTPTRTTSPSPSSDLNSSAVSATHSSHMSVLAIVLLAVGGFFLFLISCLLLRRCMRPKKRTHPIPSLPILQEEYSDTKIEGDEESLFGGKERTSARPGSNGILWNWTQYPHKSLSRPDLPGNVVEKLKQPPSPLRNEPVTATDAHLYPFTGYGTTAPQHPTKRVSQPIQTQLQDALNRAANRVSAMSMSIYPTSPQPTTYNSIGVALGGGSSPLTADGQSVLQRSNPKATARRQSTFPSNAKARQSVIGLDTSDNQHTELYGGTDTFSPIVPVPPPKASYTPLKTGGGRVPVKASYTPATQSALRGSNNTLSAMNSRNEALNAARRQSLLKANNRASQYILPPLSHTKSEERRERDTKALTSAMGLASPPPPPPSPQPTLYPDDSITLAGDRRLSRNLGSHQRMFSQVGSPTFETSARLGNLMMGSDFQSVVSMPSNRMINHSQTAPLQLNSSSKSNLKPAVKKKADDKPPRVPSPPPMPSLAQMALSHANPDAYNDYRSPTYSIYGLYDPDRKSRLSSTETGY
ncbi:hypothetical protein ABKN59_004147 [Abortiporus biennis]